MLNAIPTFRVLLLTAAAFISTGALADMYSLASVEQLRGQAGDPGDQALLAGYSVERPGIGGGLFVWDAASTVADNGGTVIAPAGSEQGRWLRQGARVTIEDFGAYQGQPLEESTAVINAAINAMAGRPLVIPVGRYRYVGANLSESISLVGERMPTVSADLSRLEHGSILEGVALFRPNVGSFSDFGVDHGRGAFPDLAADALKIATDDPDTGRMLSVRNVVGLGRDPADRFHAVLIEGYRRAAIENVFGYNNIFGLAIKVSRATVNGVHVENNGMYGVIVKSDVNHGTTKEFAISNVVVDGRGVAQIGLQIESYDKQLAKVSVSNLMVSNAQSAFRVAGNVMASEVQLMGVNATGITGDAIRQEGTAYNLQLANISLASVGGRAAKFDLVRHLAVANLTASATQDNQVFDTGFITVSSTSKRTAMSNVTLVRNYAAAPSVPAGVVSYANDPADNTISGGYYRTAGVGAR